jgi:tetratricopeptide (TPR) repeat protein
MAYSLSTESMSHRPHKLTTADLLQRRGVLELLLGAVAFIVYVGTLAFGFVYDDRVQIVGNTTITSWSYVPGYFAHHIWYLIDPRFAANYYRPIFLLWLKLCYSMFGVSPAGWHFASVALHITATIQVFWLARRLMKNQTAAAIASLLFAVHPVHVESVAWISGATDPLMLVAMLGSVLAFLRWQQKRSALVYVACVLLATIAFLSKEPAVVLPFLIAISAWAALPSDKQLSSTERLALIPVFVLAAGYLFLRQRIVQGFSHNMGISTTRDMIFTWPAVIVFYLRQLFLPYELSLFHDLPWVESPLSARFIVPLAILAVVIYCAVRMIRVSTEHRTLVAAFAWLAIPLAPVMYLRVYMEGEIVHDRYTYVASVGLAILLVLIAQILLRNVPEHARFSRATAVTVAFVSVFTVLTFYNQTDWADDLLLFHHSSKVAPNNLTSSLNLGIVIAEKGDQDSLSIARGIFKKIVAESPNNSGANFNLGHAEYQLHDFADAEKHVYKAIELEPRYAPWWMHFAGIELRMNKFLEAETAAREAIRITPKEPGYHAALGSILVSAQKFSDAEKEFNLELQLHPGSEMARLGLANLATVRAHLESR